MTYPEAKAAIDSSIREGLDAEESSETYKEKELDQLNDGQIEWIAAWLAGDNFGKVKEPEWPVTREIVDWLTQQASFAADTVVIEDRTRMGLTKAQATRHIVERAIEFLIGNGLVEVRISKDQGVWMQIDPPYSPKMIEPKP